MTFFKIVYLKTGSHLTEIRAHANLYKSENQLKKKLSCLKNESRNKIVHRNSARTQKEAGKGNMWLIINERCTSVVDADVKQEKLSFLMLINQCDGFFS